MIVSTAPLESSGETIQADATVNPIAGQDGTILYAQINPDDTRRPDPEEMIPVLDTQPATA